MDIVTTNISKNPKFLSEDYVNVKTVGKYTIVVQCDGNGSIGQKSDKHKIGNIWQSEVAISTRKCGQHIMNMVSRELQARGFDGEKTEAFIVDILDQQFYDRQFPIYYCLMLCILDFNRDMMYSYFSGDCGYVLYNPINNAFISNPPQIVKTLYVDRKDQIGIVPNSISNFLQEYTLQKSTEYLPQVFCLVVHSDGVGWEYKAPLSKVMNKNDESLSEGELISDPNIISEFEKSYKYVEGNIPKYKMKYILSKMFGYSAYDIALELLENMFPLKKLDDLSMCIIKKIP